MLLIIKASLKWETKQNYLLNIENSKTIHLFKIKMASPTMKLNLGMILRLLSTENLQIVNEAESFSFESGTILAVKNAFPEQ